MRTNRPKRRAFWTAGAGMIAGAVAPALATVYNVATNFSNNAPWGTDTTWNPTISGGPTSTDSIDVASGTTFSSGNAISLSGTSRQISSLTYSPAILGMSFVANTVSVAGVNLQIDNTLTKSGTGNLAFANLGLTGSGGIALNNGTITFTSASTGTGTNQNSVSVAKDWTIGGAASGDAPTINFRANGQNYAGTLTGAVNFSTTTPTRVLTVNAQGTGSFNSTININGNLTGSIGAKEVTFAISVLGTNTNSNVVSIGGSGTSTFTASAGSKFVVGRLALTNNNANLDLVNARADGFGNVATIQLGDANVSPGASNSANIRLFSSVADTVEQAINVNGYTTASAQAFTIGGTQISGLVTFSGPISLSKPVSLLSNVVNTTTAFTGGITGGGNAISITGAGATAISNVVTGSGTLTVNNGATLTPGATAADTGTLSLASTESLTLSAGSTTLMHISGNATANTYDKIGFTGTGQNLSYGGTLSVSFLTAPTTAGTYTLFNGFGSHAWDFSTVTLPTAPSGLAWHDYGSGDLFNNSTGQIQLDAVVSDAAAIKLSTVANVLTATVNRADNTPGNDNGGATGNDVVSITGGGAKYISEIDGLYGPSADKFANGYVQVSSPGIVQSPTLVMLWLDDGPGAKTVANLLAYLVANAGGAYQVLDNTTGEWQMLDDHYANFNGLIKFTSNAMATTDAFSWKFEGGYADITVDKIAIVPEPASLSILGLAGLGLVTRRRRMVSRRI